MIRPPNPAVVSHSVEPTLASPAAPVWIGSGVLRETLAIGIEERLQRQDPRVTFRPSSTRPADSNGEMDMWDAL